jgi:putative ABC transport system permease protein
LVRAFLTEGLLLAGAGAAAGVALAYALVRLIPQLGVNQIPRLGEAQVDARVVLFAAGLALLSALVFGLVPALAASRTNVQSTLQESGRGAGHGRSRRAFRSALIAAEVAVAIVLLVGAGLLVRSFDGLLRADLGFEPQNVLTAQLSLQGEQYSKHLPRANFYVELLKKVRAIPGVTQAAAVRQLPLTGAGWQPLMSIEGRPVRTVAEGAVVDGSGATPGYFGTMGIPLLAGREFTDADTADRPLVIIVDEMFVKRHMQGLEPLGHRIKMSMTADESEPWREIVGVVKSVRRGGVAEEMKAGVYLPHGQRSFGQMTLVARTSVAPASVLSAMRQAVAELDREQTLASVMTLEQEFAGAVAQPRFTAWLLGVFAAVALALSAVGAYGVISYSVAQRTHEIGVRMALGAQPGDVRRMVLRQGMGVVLIGAAVGLGCAVAMTRALRTMLFGVSATDPATYATVTALLLATALAACWIPARRATRVDPLIALRHE